MHRKKSDAGQNPNEPNIKNKVGGKKEFARDSETIAKKLGKATKR